MKKLTTISDYALHTEKKRGFLKRYGVAFVFLAPFLFFFLLFCVYPLFYGIVMSLFKFNIADYTQNEWRGLKNFITLLFSYSNTYYQNFWYSMKNTLWFVVILVPLAIVVPLVMAILVNAQPKGYKIFRAIIYLPSILPVSASGVIFVSLFGTNFGYLNQWMGTTIDWLGGVETAKLVIILLCMWGGWGGNFIILSAGLKNVNKSLYEAASVDGCVGFRRTLAVTLPAIKQQLVLCIFTTIIGYFGLYGQVYVLTNGGPNIDVNGQAYGATMTIMWYLQSCIQGGNFNVYGMVSAMGLLLGAFIGILTGIQLWLTRDKKSGTKISAQFSQYVAEKKLSTATQSATTVTVNTQDVTKEKDNE